VTMAEPVVGEVVDDEVVVVVANGRGRRWWRRGALGLLAVAVGYYALCFVQVQRASGRDEAGTVDAIVVLGAAQYDGRPSPVLRQRLDHVVELWDRGLARFVVVTGGNQPGDRFTEAEASADYLVENGVPADVILGEGSGRTTYQSLRSVSELLGDRSLRSVLLVTDPYHALRARLTAEEVGLDATVSPVENGPNGFGRRVQEAGGVAVGRIIGFGRLSGITG
jgi:uncharacterized SAM-binding protein YcdF (DUF218 family)